MSKQSSSSGLITIDMIVDTWHQVAKHDAEIRGEPTKIYMTPQQYPVAMFHSPKP